MPPLTVEINTTTFVVQDTWGVSVPAGDALVDLVVVGMFLGTMLWRPIADVNDRMHVLSITMAGRVVSTCWPSRPRLSLFSRSSP